MIEKQNITLSIPKSLLRQAKIVAIEQDKSLSGLMIELLTELVEHKEEYAAAKRRHLALLAENNDLGINGKITWTRESLHER